MSKSGIFLIPNSHLKMKIRINADDFGISPGVNAAVEEMFHAGKLHSASLICGCGYLENAIAIAKRNPQLKIGLHFNLSVGYSLIGQIRKISLLTDSNHRFKNGFLQLFLLSILQRKKFLTQVENALEIQLNAIEKEGIVLNHIDSHRHIHYIPGIFNLVLNAAKKRKITVRIINEKFTFSKAALLNAGFVKWLILRGFGLINGARKLHCKTYFFSILNTCKITPELIDKIEIPQNFEEIEIMIHPGNPGMDEELSRLEERKHLLSQNRVIEKL